MQLHKIKSASLSTVEYINIPPGKRITALSNISLKHLNQNTASNSETRKTKQPKLIKRLADIKSL